MAWIQASFDTRQSNKPSISKHTFFSELDMILLTGSGSCHTQNHGEDLKLPEDTQLSTWLKLNTKLGLRVQACHTNYLEVWGRTIEFKAYLGQGVSSRLAWAT